MDYFKTYSSNTLGSSANQTCFHMDSGAVRTSRVFYKLFASGAYHYSLFFSNTLDSSYHVGDLHSTANEQCEPWTILDARVARCRADVFDGDVFDADAVNRRVDGFVPLTFHGETTVCIEAGGQLHSDPVLLTFDSGEYLCLEMTFSGTKLPYHEESILPIYAKTADGWVYHKEMPLPGMVGCDRRVEKRIAFWGDSITQGIGTDVNAYVHWNALAANEWNPDNAYWNIGIGYGRAKDMAQNGVWAHKATQNDTVILCCGVNDILQRATLEELIADIDTTVDILLSAGVKVVLQTVPPFDYGGDDVEKWHAVNAHIRTDLSERVAAVFDTVPVLCLSETQPHRTQYGAHPNADGCRAWAQALTAEIDL